MMDKPLTIWWRDDDVGADDAATSLFADRVDRWRLPVAMAVIPADLSDATVACLGPVPWITLLQHGWSHRDHALSGDKKIELGGNADRARLRRDLLAGDALLEQAFKGQYLPLMVPPWNRIDDDVIQLIGQGPWVGLSTYGDRHKTDTDHIYRLNTHLDAVDWRGDRRPKSTARLHEEFAALQNSKKSWLEPVGILTHHRVMGEAEMDAFGVFLHEIASSAEIRFAAVRDLVDLAT